MTGQAVIVVGTLPAGLGFGLPQLANLRDIHSPNLAFQAQWLDALETVLPVQRLDRQTSIGFAQESNDLVFFSLSFRAPLTRTMKRSMTGLPQAVPEHSEQWLQALAAKDMQSIPFPLHELLSGSLYYPASGLDGDPVRYLGKHFHSFVFVDYTVSEEQLDEKVNRSGFKGYEVIGQRRVMQSELIPHGWQPTHPTPEDEDPRKYKNFFKQPFCTWYVFARAKNFHATHGPERFSLLFLCADGVAAYQALYVANGLHAGAVAIIQPGTGFGLNYTAFENPTKIFGRTVMGNSAGAPDQLLHGGIGPTEFYATCCWPDYSQHLAFFPKAGGGTVSWWARPSPADCAKAASPHDGAKGDCLTTNTQRALHKVDDLPSYFFTR